MHEYTCSIRCVLGNPAYLNRNDKKVQLVHIVHLYISGNDFVSDRGSLGGAFAGSVLSVLSVLGVLFEQYT